MAILLASAQQPLIHLISPLKGWGGSLSKRSVGSRGSGGSGSAAGTAGMPYIRSCPGGLGGGSAGSMGSDNASLCTAGLPHLSPPERPDAGTTRSLGLNKEGPSFP